MGREEGDDGHNDAVAGEVVRVRGAFRQSIGFGKPHEAWGLALQQLARPDAGAIDQDYALSRGTASRHPQRASKAVVAHLEAFGACGAGRGLACRDSGAPARPSRGAAKSSRSNAEAIIWGDCRQILIQVYISN
jgi:hypothetical protein